MRIVYREAPDHFKLLRTVDHTHPDHAELNRAYETWEKDYLANYQRKTAVPAEKPPLERDQETRKRFYMK